MRAAEIQLSGKKKRHIDLFQGFLCFMFRQYVHLFKFVSVGEALKEGSIQITLGKTVSLTFLVSFSSYVINSKWQIFLENPSDENEFPEKCFLQLSLILRYKKKTSNLSERKEDQLLHMDVCKGSHSSLAAG